MFRALVAAGAVVALFMAARDGIVFKELGLTGSCRTVTTPPGMAGEWVACSPGKLDGRPDLSRRPCLSRAQIGDVEYWVCPFGREA
jgi:hypothetical protein